LNRSIIAVSVAFVLSGCAGLEPSSRTIYTPPAAESKASLTKTISAPRDEVWGRAVPALSRSGFQVRTLDKESGFIHLTFTAANPTEYVDCGRVDWELTDNGVQHRWHAAAAEPLVSLEGMLHGRVVAVQRRVTVQGNVNLVFESLAPAMTRVTATYRYGVSRTIGLIPRNPQRSRRKPEDTAAAPIAADAKVLTADINEPEPMTCVTRPKLAAELLEAIN
jgi:hypothetical protein